MPESTDEQVRIFLGNEQLSEDVKRPVLESQIAKLRAMLEIGRPGWQDEIHESVEIHEHGDPCGSIPVVQHGEIE